jgi:hypothetical protein
MNATSQILSNRPAKRTKPLKISQAARLVERIRSKSLKKPRRTGKLFHNHPNRRADSSGPSPESGATPTADLEVIPPLSLPGNTTT